MSRGTWALLFIALVARDASAQRRYQPCRAPTGMTAVLPNEIGNGASSLGVTICNGVHWCDARNVEVGCCEANQAWNGTACVCSARAHDDHGHCCLRDEQWQDASGDRTGFAPAGSCCPPGTQASRSPTFTTDTGIRGGDRVACCPPGSSFDGVQRSDAPPCAQGERRSLPGGAVACRNSGEGVAGGAAPDVQIHRVGATAPDGFERVARAGRIALLSCYQSALREDPTRSGATMARLDVREDGTIGDVSIVENRGPIGSMMNSCIQRTIRAWRFPRSSEASQPTVEISFLRANRAASHHATRARTR